jgi:F-type H+-transporting ATPase subunit gamma
MPSLKTIRTRITSVRSTEKITRAMKMVAGARLARAQQRITALRPYAVRTSDILKEVASTMRSAEAEAPTDDGMHPLLRERPEKKVLMLVLTSDRGLCGAFNSNVSKAAERAWIEKRDQGIEVEFGTLGRKGRDYLSRRRGKVANDFAKIYDGLDMAKAKVVSHWIVPRYLRGEWDAVYVVYNEFKSAITQKVTVEKLLPLAKEEAPDQSPTLSATEFTFEPDQKRVLERLVPMYVDITLYRAMLESQASEYGARMTAMDAATRNAKDMIGRLTLLYNRARQAAITKELMEIIGGAEALKD